MKSKSTISTPAITRCQKLSPSGRRCRMAVADPASGLCYTHAVELMKQRDLHDLTANLTQECEGFQYAAGINHSLAQLYKLLAANKISPRRASVLAYITNLLLRTLPAIDHDVELGLPNDSAKFNPDQPSAPDASVLDRSKAKPNPSKPNGGVTVIWDVPGMEPKSDSQIESRSSSPSDSQNSRPAVYSQYTPDGHPIT